MLLHWNSNPSKERDEGDAFRMATDGSGLSIVNMMPAHTPAVTSLDSHAGVLAAATNSNSLSIFLGPH